MRVTGFKNNAGGFKKLWAFFSIAILTALMMGVGGKADAAISYGVTEQVYTGYTGSTGVRPMDNPAVVNNYTLCKTATVSNIDTNWGSGVIEGCAADYVLIHYTGYFYSPNGGTYTFQGYSDDGFYAKIGSTVVVNNWSLQGCAASSTGASITMAAGEYRALDAWFFEHGGGACSHLFYAPSGSGSTAVPASMLTTTNYTPATFTNTSITSQVVQGGSYSSGVTASSTGTQTYSLLSGSLPPGLSLDHLTGGINGTATTSGTYTFRIHVSANDNGTITTDDTGTLTITVGTNSSLLTPLRNETLWIGEEFTDRAVFGGQPTPTVTKLSGTLPPGLTLSSNGTVSGTPTTAGTYTFKLRGTNFVDSTDSANYTYTVMGAPVFTTNGSYTRTVEYGDTVSDTPTVTGEGLVFTLVGDVPTGLSLNPNTGELSGTANEAGQFSFKVIAKNRSGAANSSQSTITVNRTPVFTSSSVATTLNKGSAYSFDFAADGYPAPTFSVVSGRLPAGLVLESDGTLHGTPTTGDEYTFTVRATNVLDTVEVTKTISVIQAPFAIDDTLQLLILAGGNYADAVHFGGFPAPTYEIVEGSLPLGLELNSGTGAITGHPSLGGLYNFKVKATGGNLSATTDNFALIVNQPPTMVDDVIATTTDLGKLFNDGVSTTGYPLPTYTLKSGALPIGLKLNAATGAVTGTTTSTGVYSFVIEATNSVGVLAMPATITVQQAPVFLRGDFPATLNLGDNVSTKLIATGFPTPTYAVTTGALPDGLSLDANTGEITGVTTNGGSYLFVVSAINSVGTTAFKAISVEVAGVETQIDVAAKIGDVITGKEITIASGGLKPAAPYEVVLRSSPQTIATGAASAKGTVTEQAKIPAGLEPGWHSITLTSVKPDGTAFEKAVYFQVTETLMLEEISQVPPTDAQLSDALTNDPEFYAKMGIDPAATVTPAAAAAQVEQVTSVVASVALVSAAAAGAAAAASAAGGAASSAGGSAGGSARGGGGSSSGGARSSGGGSSSSSSSSSGGDGGKSDDSDGGDYGNLEADHDDFETEGSGVVDRLKIWKLGILTALDKPLTNWIERSAQVSPVLSRILNDGSYLRALIGSFMGVAYFAAVVLGIAAVDPSASSMATSGRIDILLAIMAIGTLDALFGILAMSAFVITSLIAMPTTGVGDVRYLLAMFILGFAPSIMATTFRKIRRPAIENLSDAWERIIDIALIGFISVLTVMSLVGSVSAFAGATVPLSADVKPIALAIAAVAITRVLVEEAAAKLAPDRLNRINPTEVPGTFAWQPWASLVLKASVLVLMIGGMVGMGWHLWVGTFLIFLPGIIGMVFPELPSFKWIHEFIPGGVGALAFATLISSWSGQIVNALLGKSELYGQLSFILIPLPVILIAVIGMFAKQDEKLWKRANKSWLYIAGGIAVFVFTIQVTDFFPTIFG